MKKLFFASVACVLLSVVTGCAATSNNSLTLRDFAQHLNAEGVKVEAVQPLRPHYGATEAISLQIAGKMIGIYKFNVNVATSAQRLAELKKKGYIYFNAEKYPVLFNGTFMVVRYESNPEKKAIVRAVESF